MTQYRRSKRVPAPSGNAASNEEALMSLLRLIACGDQARAFELLADAPELTQGCLAHGATRHDVEGYFLDAIGRVVYAGDTALHIAAACYATDMIRALAGAGAEISAANRRGAQPLHYAVDGRPGSGNWSPRAQSDAVLLLVRLGADPNAVDKNGTSPLHRAVRNRCADAVRALLESGADPRAPNRSGSTPMQLAHWTTGRTGSGADAAKAQQQEIVRLLRAAGVA